MTSLLGDHGKGVKNIFHIFSYVAIRNTVMQINAYRTEKLTHNVNLLTLDELSKLRVYDKGAKKLFEKRITAVVEAYNAKNILQYLRSIGQNISF